MQPRRRRPPPVPPAAPPGSAEVRPGIPVDPDVDLRRDSDQRELRGASLAVLTAIAVGGAIGATARALVATWSAPAEGGFPVPTLAANVVGSALIGVLMTWIARRRVGHRLVRPFLGVGVLGGFTTFSAYALDARALVVDHALLAVAAVATTPVLALTAVWLGARLTESLVPERAP